MFSIIAKRCKGNFASESRVHTSSISRDIILSRDNEGNPLDLIEPRKRNS